jgi:hypothetical protein
MTYYSTLQCHYWAAFCDRICNLAIGVKLSNGHYSTKLFVLPQEWFSRLHS